MRYLKVEKIDEESFEHLETSWDNLLWRSDADPLFMSWSWLFSWWDTWGHELGLELLLLCVTDREEGLVGIAPLYRHRHFMPFGFRRVCLHFLGNAWRISNTVRTEYVGLIAQRGFEKAVTVAVSSYLRTEPWDEMILCDATEMTMHQLKGGLLREQKSVSELVRDQATGIRINTENDFGNWLSKLGRNTRLKTYNRRSFFEGEYGGSFHVAGGSRSEQARFFKQLNVMHINRWGKPCFDQRAVEFHLDFLGRLSSSQSGCLSFLSSRDRIVAAQYDIQAGKCRYNLQSAFDEHFHKKISLGTLHMGYAIELAFRDPHVKNYDLLAGEGKNTFYKEHYKGEPVTFYTSQYTRNRIFRLMYRSQFFLPETWRKFLNSAFRL